MINKEHALLIPFLKEPWKARTFKEIKHLVKKTSESYVYNTLKKHVKQGLLKEQRAGNVILYSLDISTAKTQSTIGFISEHLAWNTKHLPTNMIQTILKKLQSPYFTLIITGSYAKNKQTENSDVDIVVIIDDKADPKSNKAQIQFTCETSIPPGHPYVFKASEFLQMLTNKEINYGTEIAKNNIILFGGQEYYRIMHEAIEHGFDG